MRLWPPVSGAELPRWIKGAIAFLILFPWLSLLGLGIAGYEVLISPKPAEAGKELQLCIEGAPGCGVPESWRPVDPGPPVFWEDEPRRDPPILETPPTNPPEGFWLYMPNPEQPRREFAI